MQRKKYLLTLFDAIPEEHKTFLNDLRQRYELEANRNRLELAPNVLDKVLAKEEKDKFEELYYIAHKTVFGPDELKHANAYLAGGITAKEFIKLMGQKPAKNDTRNADTADLLAGRILRTMKPNV